MQNGQNPALYTGVSPRANASSLYSGSGVRDSDAAISMTNILAHHPHLGHHQPGTSHLNPSMPPDSLSGSARDHHPLLHARYTSKSASGLNGIIVPGLPSFATQRSFDSHAVGTSGGSIVHHGSGSTIHTANLNEAFVNSFGLTSGSFLSPYFADRNRTPSPLHRFLQNQLLGGHHVHSTSDHHFSHDDLLLDSSGSFRGLNLSNNYAHGDRHHADPLMGSGHLSRSLDDLSVMLDNSNDSVDLSMPHRHSSSPDESVNNDLTQSESVSSTVQVRTTSRSSSKRRSNGRTENSRTCPTCGKAFGNSSGLAKHRLTHSDERKYTCSICMKSFKRQDHLSGHMLTHSDKKPFECPVDSCGKSYCDSRSLKRHLDQHEPWLIPEQARLMFNDGTGETSDDQHPQINLAIAGREFQFTGSDLKPFVCQICRRRFKNGPALNGHMRLHGGFFNKTKGGDLYASAPPSVQQPKSMDSSSQNSCDLNLVDLSPHSVQPLCTSQWSTASELTQENAISDQLNPLNQVAVIRHVPPVIIHSALPPVKSLASPVNSPTTLNAPFSFFPVSPAGSPATPAQPSFPAVLSTGSTTLALPVVAVNGKIRRHSDSDNLVPAKRMKPTVADRLRHTISMNMVKRMNSASPERDVSNPFGFHRTAQMEEFGIEDEKPPLSFLFPVPALLETGLYDDPLPDNFHTVNDDRLPNDTFVVKSPESVTSSSGSSNTDYAEASSSSASPSLLVKRIKPRPEPLYIPPHASTAQPSPLSPGNESSATAHNRQLTLSPSHNALPTPPAVSSLLSPGIGYHSRLRSPLPREGEKYNSPPPYTPPPMLSPNRNGTGLFWTVMNGNTTNGTTTPQSGAKFLLRRSLSSSSTGHLDSQGFFRRGSTGGSTNAKDEHDPRESPFYFGPALDAPVSDLMPHINLGERHQADLPAFDSYRVANILNNSPPEDLMWKPDALKDLSEQEVRDYVALADSGVVPKSGRNTELAHHLLYLTSGDVRLCSRALLSTDILCSIVPPHHPIREYRYQESDLWSQEEIAAFSSALLKYDKDFYLVSAAVQSKTTKQCVEFYYCWKKLSTDEYKRMRAARSRFRRQEELVTRSKTAAAQATEPVEQQKTVTESTKQKDTSGPYACPQPNCGTFFATKQALSAHSRVHLPRNNNRVPATLDKCPPPDPKGRDSPADRANKRRDASPYQESEATEFPCRLCGKVFQGIKSRNAHMKVHRLTESQSTSLVSSSAQ